MVSLTKILSQALMIVSNNPLEIISRGFILRDMLDSCPCNRLTLSCQDPVERRAAYYVIHANPCANPQVLFRLLLVPILSKVVVTKIGPFTYVKIVASYAFRPCVTAFLQGVRVNISFPYQSETPTSLGNSPAIQPPFPLSFDYSYQIPSAILPG